MKTKKSKSHGNLIQDLIAQREILYELEAQVRENLPFLLKNDLISQEGLINISLLEQLLQAGLWFYLPIENEVFITGPIRSITGIVSANESIPWEVFEKIISADDRILVKTRLDELWSNPGLMEIDFRTSKESHALRDNRILHLRAFRAEKLNKASFIIGTLQDVTDNRKFQEDLAKAKDKAEESDLLKTMFLSNLSHEFRNPMNAIIGFSEMINSGNIDTEKRKEYARIITRKGNYILSLIDDIAELAKFETGAVSVNRKNCDINRVAGELFLEFKEIKKEIEKDQIELRLNVPTPLTEEIYTDPGRLQQVLSNLLRNAFQFTEKGTVEFGYELKDAKTIQFYVKDTGIGVRKEDQKLVFNRFRQVEETSLRRIGRSGLGLTLSRHIINLMGGKIWFESVPSEGSTFYFTLPITTQPEEQPEQSVEHKISYNWKDKVILIVEDDEVNAQFLEAVLDQTQVQTLYAYNGLQAIELCKSINKIDLVLMDIKMPEMSGYDACKKIKAFRPGLPMIAQTAFAESVDRRKCLSLGFDDYISKPIDIELLFGKIFTFFNH
jgi:signal transduction histidine kinase